MTKKQEVNVLIIGCSPHLMLAISRLFSLPGFGFDCVSTRRVLKGHRFARGFYHCTKRNLVATALSVARKKTYEMIVVTDDKTIGMILDSEISDEDKLVLLPVVSCDDFSHLSSKIGVSFVFKKNDIPTPDFLVVKDRFELVSHACRMGFPLMVKGDRSSGGRQTEEILNVLDLDRIADEFDFFPAVLQRKIDGDLIGIEALYLEGKLIHFGYSVVLKVIGNQFSPSVVRQYSQPGSLDPQVWRELENIGRALGADGFVNISCICAKDKRHYFEADMRPTAWIAHPRYFGDDPALKILSCLRDGEPREFLPAIDQRYPERLNLPLFIRMKLWEILVNRYSVWKYIYLDTAVVRIFLRDMRIFLSNFLSFPLIRRSVRNVLKSVASTAK